MENSKIDKTTIESFCINKELYSEFNVKWGLRNKDGSGVLAGLTRLSGVTGYIKEDEEIISGGRIIRPAYKNVEVKNEYIPIRNR